MTAKWAVDRWRNVVMWFLFFGWAEQVATRRRRRVRRPVRTRCTSSPRRSARRRCSSRCGSASASRATKTFAFVSSFVSSFFYHFFLPLFCFSLWFCFVFVSFLFSRCIKKTWQPSTSKRNRKGKTVVSATGHPRSIGFFFF